MKTENLHQPFEIIYKAFDDEPQKAHQHTFFELVYILDGTGVQCINHNHFNYHKGHMFLITPSDCHSFEIHSTTSFLFIRFNDIHLLPAGLKTLQPPDWMQRMEYILSHATHKAGCILTNQTDKPLARILVENIIKEQVNNEVYHSQLTGQLVNTLLVIVARNLALNLPLQVQPQTHEPIVDIIRYIQQNIYDAAKLRSDAIADAFAISPLYLGRYFKKHTGESMQQFITLHKLKLVQTRLKHSDMRISEIVHELGFTDESHLTRLFKKHYSTTPAAYRKQSVA